MSSKKLIALAMTTMVISTSASAATLMLRQEHKSNDQNDANTNATLVKIGGSIGKTFIGTQIVHKGEKLNSYTLSSSEIQVGYRHDVNEDIRVIPQLQVTATNGGITYTPMGAVDFKLGGGFSIVPLYKHKFYVGVKNGEYNDTKQTSQYQLNLNYAKDALRLGIQYDYHKALDGQTFYNYKEFKQELELKAYYRVAKGLTPFITFAGVPVGNRSDEYQLRTRLGLLYSF
jgi:hypothetical protein